MKGIEMKDLKLEKRLIVAADFSPAKFGGVSEAYGELLKLVACLKNTGVVIKVNSILRYYGYLLIKELHYSGLAVFADLKLNDIPETMKIDGEFLSTYQPEIVTAMCASTVQGLAALKGALPRSEILGVTVLTSVDEVVCDEIYAMDLNELVSMFAYQAHHAGLGGLVCSPKELNDLRSEKGFEKFTLNTPGIRPAWAIVEGDDQKRIMTPTEAIAAGADRIVVGRPITQASNPLDAVRRTLDEIREGLELRA